MSSLESIGHTSAPHKPRQGMRTIRDLLPQKWAGLPHPQISSLAPNLSPPTFEMRRTAGSAPPRRSRQRTGNHSTPPVESHDDGHARKAKTQSRQFSPKPETGVGPTSPEPVYPRGYQANTSSSSCLQTQPPACQHSDCHRSIATSPKRVSSNPQPSSHTTSCAISSAEEHSQYRLTSHDYGQRAMREVTRPGVSSKVKLSPTSPTSNHYLPRVTSSTEQQSQYSQPHRDIRRGIAELDLGSRPSPSTHLIRVSTYIHILYISVQFNVPL